MNGPLVGMRGITKSFGGIAACRRVDFDLRPGEIHALLGENGAGKSTLMNILSGLYRADAGTIEIDGRPADLAGPRQARRAGIGMVHQHFMLVKNHTVAENVLLGLPGGFLLDRRAAAREIEILAARYRLVVDPSARVWQLSIGERQRVEILKLLRRRARVLILDEPTSVLAPAETRGLFETLRRLRDDGAGLVLISHKLEEVLAVADRVTVLAGGRKVATVPAAGTSADELAGMMFSGLSEPLREEAGEGPAREAGSVLTLEGVAAIGDRGLPALKGVTLTVAAGEVFGLLGVAGNGQKELAEVATGLRRPTAGRVLVRGRDMTGASPRDFITAGVAHIPEDRLGMGIVSSMTLAENLALKGGAGGAGFLPDRRGMERAAAEILRRFGVSPADPGLRAGSLSGGNIQRLIAARELAGSPRLLVASCPFQGLDVAAVDFLAGTLRDRAAAGLAVLLIGDDVETTLAASHRVGVIRGGRLVGVSPSALARVGEIGLMMAGGLPGGDGA